MALNNPEVTRLCLRQLGKSVGSSRQFSSTARRRKNGPLCVFPPTSNPELDELLASLRNTVFMPSHLSREQRFLLYRRPWQRFLTGEEPVKVDVAVAGPGATNLFSQPSEAKPVAKENFQLQPINRVRDEPRHAKTYNRIIDLLAMTDSSEAWDKILPALLRELHASQRRVTAAQLEKLVRRATEAGKIGLLLNCLRRVEALGLRIQTTGVAHHLMLGTHDRAIRAGFGLGPDGLAVDEGARNELDRAVRNAEAILVMLDDERHVPQDKGEHPLSRPEVHGAVLALVAARRLLWQTQNTADKTAARSEALNSAMDVELPKAAEDALENSEGETPAEAAAEAAEASGEATEDTSAPSSADSSAPTEVFAQGADDQAALLEHARALLANSERADLSFDASSPVGAKNLLTRWLPAWFGMQAAARALGRGGSGANVSAEEQELRGRLQAAFDAEVGPQVAAAVEAVRALPEGKRAPLLMTVHEAYVKFLEATK